MVFDKDLIYKFIKQAIAFCKRIKFGRLIFALLLFATAEEVALISQETLLLGIFAALGFLVLIFIVRVMFIVFLPSMRPALVRFWSAVNLRFWFYLETYHSHELYVGIRRKYYKRMVRFRRVWRYIIRTFKSKK